MAAISCFRTVSRIPQFASVASRFSQHHVLVATPPRLSARCFATEQKSSNKTADDSSESDRRYEETGEYDTQDRYKRVGNPIAWANPTGGGVEPDNSSKHWTWVYPAGAGLILGLCLISRWRNQNAEKEAEVIDTISVTSPDTRRFTYQPPPSEPITDEDLALDSSSPLLNQTGLSSDTLSTLGGTSSSFSAPPPSSRW
eukprot:TRINITY_DN94768_c0_g1_i1.p1 TRINITY_DN94768_c0_g1~~TRINITY_DN94768_c0_g1_i1.p1  ORF type:complete len:199 (+),score=28.23 TRINITY_DN94768_c0_g1_i1:75-671(+)